MNKVFLTCLFQELNNLNIKYCVLRNYDGLPNSLRGSDLDLMIDLAGLEMFYKMLDRVLCQLNGKVIIKYGDLTPRLCIAGINRGHMYGLQLDIHHGILPYKSTPIFPVDFLFSRVEKHNNIFVANDNDASIVAFLKEILNNNKCKEEYFIEASLAWSAEKSLYKNVLLNIYGSEFLVITNDIMSHSFNQEEIKKLAIYARKILSKGVINKVNHLKLNISKLHRIFYPPGFAIAFIGVDGAGKTTIINAVDKVLKVSVHNSLYHEHMRPNMIPSISKLFGKKKKTGPVINPHALESSGLIGSFLRLFYYTFDYIFGYWIKVYTIKVKKSSIWIFDRYFYDYLIDQKRSRIRLPRWVIFTVLFFVPKPDLVFCLGSDPNIIYNRKKELPLNEVARQLNVLKHYSSSNSRMVWVDTGGGVDKTVKQIFDLIVNKMALRYENK